jgi:type IV fimbrial biogenesis protein FimT
MSARLHRRYGGFTLIELMITLVIVVIILLLAVPSFRDTIARNRVEGQAGELNTDLQYARTEAVTRNAAVGVFIGTNCYTVYTVGSTDASACATLGTGATSLKSVTLDAGNSLSLTFASNNSQAFLQFEPVRGMATNATGTDFSGNVTVATSVGGWQLRADVTQFGRVKLCSPSGTFSGYPSC